MENNKIQILLISPLHDLPTINSYRMQMQLFGLLSKNNQIVIHKCFGIESDYIYVKSVIMNNKIDLVVYMGHGFGDTWLNGILGFILRKEMSSLFKDCIVYSMACHTANKFGYDVVKKGARAYIGNTEVVWTALNTKKHNFAVDFSRIWQDEVLNLLRGSTVKEVVEFTRARWYSLADSYRAMAQENRECYMYIDQAYYNGKYHVYIGDGDAHLNKTIDGLDDLNLDAINSTWGLFL